MTLKPAPLREVQGGSIEGHTMKGGNMKREPNWIPACGGTERPFRTRTGKTLLYCWDTRSGNHAYLDCESDIILTDAEALEALGWT